jgi:hypothetical protein
MLLTSSVCTDTAGMRTRTDNKGVYSPERKERLARRIGDSKRLKPPQIIGTWQ